jgi:hypothetical protein
VAVGLGVYVAVGVGLYVAVAVGATGAGAQPESALTNMVANRKQAILFMVFLLKKIIPSSFLERIDDFYPCKNIAQRIEEQAYRSWSSSRLAGLRKPRLNPFANNAVWRLRAVSYSISSSSIFSTAWVKSREIEDLR